jgi:dipeptidyl aminopeptidase/acylaminoacyl peptidase
VVELFRSAGTPRWSPDSQRLAFDSRPEGQADIYLMSARGGAPVRLTSNPTDDVMPSWSRDGKWVYFSSVRSGAFEIWKAPVGGGGAIQVTRNGGRVAFESLDANCLYYTKGTFSGLWRIPTEGGEESEVLPSVYARNFVVVKDGIYFIPEADQDGRFFLQHLDFASGEVKTIAPIRTEYYPYHGLSVSPDGQWILYSQVDRIESDLMLMENFR